MGEVIYLNSGDSQKPKDIDERIKRHLTELPVPTEADVECQLHNLINGDRTTFNAIVKGDVVDLQLYRDRSDQDE